MIWIRADLTQVPASAQRPIVTRRSHKLGRARGARRDPADFCPTSNTPRSFLLGRQRRAQAHLCAIWRGMGSGTDRHRRAHGVSEVSKAMAASSTARWAASETCAPFGADVFFLPRPPPSPCRLRCAARALPFFEQEAKSGDAQGDERAACVCPTAVLEARASRLQPFRVG